MASIISFGESVDRHFWLKRGCLDNLLAAMMPRAGDDIAARDFLEACMDVGDLGIEVAEASLRDRLVSCLRESIESELSTTSIPSEEAEHLDLDAYHDILQRLSSFMANTGVERHNDLPQKGE